MGLQWQVRYLLCERMKFIGITVEECNLGFTFRIGGWIVSHIKCCCPKSSPLEKLQSWWYYCQWQWNIKKTTFDNSFLFSVYSFINNFMTLNFCLCKQDYAFFFKWVLSAFLHVIIDTGRRLLVHCGIYHLMTGTGKQLLQLVALRHWYGVSFGAVDNCSLSS